MSTGIISTGITGIQVAQLGLQTAEHNITNASTPGFNRQRIVQASNIAVATGSGYVGQGAHVSTIERMYDRFLYGQVNTAQSTSSELETYYNQIKQIDNMLADANSGVSPALQEFFTGVNKVAANPSQLPSRQAMISSAQALVSRYQALESRISELYAGVNSQLISTVSTINSYSQQIASLNENIVTAQASTNQPPNDLLDQRDQLVAELNKLVKVTTTTNSNGTFNVFVGSGQQLVVGTQVSDLVAVPSGEDPSRFTVALKTLGGKQELPESLLTGGSLGGLLAFRSESLDKTANDLGRNAASLALTFNAQHRLGQDMLGNGGVDFFTISSPTVIASSGTASTSSVTATLSAPSMDGVYTLSQVAAGSPFVLTRQSDGQAWSSTDSPPTLGNLSAQVASEGLDLTNTVVTPGTVLQVSNAAAAGGNFYTKLTGSDYRLSRDATGYTMTRLSDNKVWTNASLDTLSTTVANSEGFTFSGTLTNGDSFIIQPTRTLARNIALNPTVANDTRLVAAAMPFRTAATTTNTGTGRISDGISLPGYGFPALPAAGVTVAYDSSTTPPSLTFTNLPAGASVSVKVGNTVTGYDPAAATPIPYSSGATITVAGMSFSISGNLINGDSFTLKRNTSGVSDGRNALALGQLQTQNTMSGKTASYQSAYAQLVSDNGNKTREISVKSQAQAALLQQSQAARDSLSGVNLDEEAANLMRYQQAYQASAKVLEMGSKLFDSLLAIMA